MHPNGGWALTLDQCDEIRANPIMLPTADNECVMLPLGI